MTLIEIISSKDLNEEQKLAKLRKELEKTPILTTTRNVKKRGATPVAEAARLGYVRILRFLIEEKQANPNLALNNGKTPLEIAIGNSHEEAAIYLIGKVDKILNVQSQQFAQFSGYASVYDALQRNQLKVVEALFIKEPALRTMQFKDFNTPLHIATEYCSCEVVEYLLSAPNKNLEMVNQQGYTPYHIALFLCHHECIACMLKCTQISPASTLFQEKLRKPLDIVLMNKEVERSDRIKSINALLAAGAGLDSSTIPEAALNLLELKRENIGKFLLQYYQCSADGRYVRNIPNLQTLELALKLAQSHPTKWEFHLAQIARATCGSVRHLPHVKEIQAFLPEEIMSTAQSLFTPFPSLNLAPPDVARMKRDDFSEFSQKMQLYYIAFNEKRFKFDKCIKSLNVSTLSEDERYLSYEGMLDAYFNALDQMLDFAEHEAAASVIGVRGTIFDEIPADMANKIYSLLEIGNVVSLETYGSTFHSALKSVIKQKGNLLRQNAIPLYMRLVELQAKIAINIAGAHLKVGSGYLAFSMVRQPLSSLEKLFELASTEDKKSLGMFASHCLIILASAALNERWIDKALENIIRAMPFCDKRTFPHVEMLVLIMAIKNALKEQQRYNAVITLLNATIEHLKSLQLETREDIERSEFLLQALYNECAECKHEGIQQLKVILAVLGSISCEAFSLSYCLQQKDLHGGNQYLFKQFLENHPLIQYEEARGVLIFTEAFVGSADCIAAVRSLVALLSLKHGLTESKMSASEGSKVDLVDSMTHQFNALTIQMQKPKKPKEKPKEKRKGTADPAKRKGKEKEAEKETETSSTTSDENYGFIRPDGFSPIIPITGSGIPDNVLFLTLSNAGEFSPFLGLIYNRHVGYHTIPSIPERGFNKQGVKLGTSSIFNPHGRPQQIATARLKILGTEGHLRARGQVRQEIKVENQTKRLYVIDEVVTKKEEKRKRYSA
ncbi:ankyrin repeat domain-containing protein [Candidatus Berkiella aquae]|uniref:Ankyrin repeat domain-containing protein n=1 Tax=Candidatus Berkiella aquae TaxID=295108 RepID=A0A0Q9YQ09_9GAMM|nr:ankyrin repeat domain-containing protein [Candidatus Berkiella aquae]MCS5710302.1 ankyrin repeat domain-containing protein [Candidatus Berkiella aquae]